MAQRFVKGLTNNHLTWVMVDATDFATPESALSAATTIKIYGKLRGGTGVNFVSSGTGSLTNDIIHVGASATGIYTIALVKADLSDASAAWYDQYIVHLSATGAARQTLVVDGGIVESNLSAIQSDIYSAALLIQSLASDAVSQALLATSMASDALSAAVVAQSINASDMSDLRSAIAAGPAATVTASDISDIASAVWAAKYTAHSAASSFGSLFSDVYSRVVQIQSLASDAHSAAILGASHASDAHSAALLAQSYASDALSQALLASSRASDAHSMATANSDALSNVLSALVVIDDFLDTEIAQINSRVLLAQSFASDAHSAALLAASAASDTYSALTGAHAEPTGIPAANESPLDKLGYVFAALRNKVTVTSTKMQFFDDADVALWEKDLTDDGTTYTETEGNLP